ncbi:hypothetical protein ACFSQE_04480 [Vogesella fluminis]
MIVIDTTHPEIRIIEPSAFGGIVALSSKASITNALKSIIGGKIG